MDAPTKTTPSFVRSKLLPSLVHGTIVALIYLAVKHFTKGLIERDIWLALMVGAIVGIIQSLPWSTKSKPAADDATK